MSMKKILIIFCSFWVVILFASFTPLLLFAGSYADSAHGNSSAGVKRNSGHLASIEYAIGNCAHCHEQHASIGGSEPEPDSGQPSAFSLFADSFSNRAVGPYVQTDNFCFYCHVNVGSVQIGGWVANELYSKTFGCSTFSDTSSIMGAFNLHSYHNLTDIQDYAKSNFIFFKNYSNPCTACHNPHIARRNREHPSDPGYSAISKPSDHENLWSTTMGSVYNTRYEPLYCNSSHSNREPGASGDDIQGRANTPDYVGFCTDCHTPTANIYSTTLGRNLRRINWGVGGDKHGAQLTDSRYPRNADGVPVTGGGGLVQPPYVKASFSYDYILSCLDCHEPHGSPNVMLLRRRVNGGELGKIILTMDDPGDDGVIPNDNKDIGYLCLRCHYDDKAACAAGIDFGVNCSQDNHWRHIHHRENIAWDTPYCGGQATPPDTQLTCGGDGALRCHAWPGNGMGIPHCNDCHYHGSVVTITNGKCANEPDSTRKTF